MNPILETERLILREFTLKDADFIVELLNSPGWIRYIGDKNIKTHEQAVEYLKNGPLHSYIKNGFGLYLVERKIDTKALGMCGILKREYLEYPDIGFAFLPEFYGKGFAFEITKATLHYAKTKLGFSNVSAIATADNYKSIKLLQKIGLKYQGKLFQPESNDELHIFCN